MLPTNIRRQPSKRSVQKARLDVLAARTDYLAKFLREQGYGGCAVAAENIAAEIRRAAA